MTSQTPFSPFVIGAPWPLPGMSPPITFTACAFGARIRKMTFFSAVTSGETTTGPWGPRPPRPGWAGAAGCAQAETATKNSVASAIFIDFYLFWNNN